MHKIQLLNCVISILKQCVFGCEALSLAVKVLLLFCLFCFLIKHSTIYYRFSFQCFISKISFKYWVQNWKIAKLLCGLFCHFKIALAFLKKFSRIDKRILWITWLFFISALNVCFKKTGTKRNSNTLLCFVQVLLWSRIPSS